MRPNTLSETYDRIIDGEAVEKAFAEFLDQFYALTDTDTRSTALAGEPRLTGDAHLDALAGATAEYLAKQYLADVPAWSHGEARSLALPWFTTDEPGSGINEYLWHSSPAEFRWRNIFTESQPFRRVSQRVVGQRL
jgi:hypothetical protein